MDQYLFGTRRILSVKMRIGDSTLSDGTGRKSLLKNSVKEPLKSYFHTVTSIIMHLFHNSSIRSKILRSCHILAASNAPVMSSTSTIAHRSSVAMLISTSLLSGSCILHILLPDVDSRKLQPIYCLEGWCRQTPSSSTANELLHRMTSRLVPKVQGLVLRLLPLSLDFIN